VRWSASSQLAARAPLRGLAVCSTDCTTPSRAIKTPPRDLGAPSSGPPFRPIPPAPAAERACKPRTALDGLRRDTSFPCVHPCESGEPCWGFDGYKGVYYSSQGWHSTGSHGGGGFYDLPIASAEKEHHRSEHPPTPHGRDMCTTSYCVFVHSGRNHQAATVSRGSLGDSAGVTALDAPLLSRMMLCVAHQDGGNRPAAPSGARMDQPMLPIYSSPCHEHFESASAKRQRLHHMTPRFPGRAAINSTPCRPRVLAVSSPARAPDPAARVRSNDSTSHPPLASNESRDRRRAAFQTAHLSPSSRPGVLVLARPCGARRLSIRATPTTTCPCSRIG